MNSYNDVLSIIENLLNESEQQVNSKNIFNSSDRFFDDMQASGLHSKKNKKENKLKDKSKDIDEDDDDNELNTDEDTDESEEKEYKVNLKDADDFEKFISLLNKFRAAHSFTEGQINEELKRYFDRLSDSEKKCMHVFFKALIQITLVEIKGKAAYVPSDLGISVSKNSSTNSEKKDSKKLKNKIDSEIADSEDIDISQNSREKLQKNSKQDDFNSPIKIGEAKQDKSDIIKLLKSY